MKRLTFIVVILALVYSGYWFLGSSAVENGAKTQFEEMAHEGWDVSYTELTTRGFPSRFDTTLTDLFLATPDRRWQYDASMLQALALSYQPTNVILAFPPTQVLTVDDTSFEFISDGLRASVSVSANTALSLDAATAEAASFALSIPPEDQLVATNFLTAIRENTNLPNTYDTYLNLENITLPASFFARIDPRGNLSEVVETITFDATVTLDRPLDRHTLAKWERDPGKLRGMTLRSLFVEWGQFQIAGNGDFTVDAAGTPDGTITVSVNDWQGLLDAAIVAGFVPDQFQFIAKSMGQTLSGGAKALELPITVQNGNLSVGPLPLGPAPKFN